MATASKIYTMVYKMVIFDENNKSNQIKRFLSKSTRVPHAKFYICKKVIFFENFDYRATLKGGDRRVRIFSAHNNWWATPEVSLPLPYQRSAKVFLNLLRQGVKTMYYFKNMYSKSLKYAK